MFQKSLRLDAAEKLANPAFYSSPLLTLKVAKNALPHNRYGFIVSKKVDKRAVVRNRVKRLMREAMQEANTTIKQGLDILSIAKPQAAKEQAQIQQEIKKLLKNV